MTCVPIYAFGFASSKVKASVKEIGKHMSCKKNHRCSVPMQRKQVFKSRRKSNLTDIITKWELVDTNSSFCFSKKAANGSKVNLDGWFLQLVASSQNSLKFRGLKFPSPLTLFSNVFMSTWHPATWSNIEWFSNILAVMLMFQHIWVLRVPGFCSEQFVSSSRESLCQMV